MAGKLVMCKGLPGSGKSTWAKDQVERNDARCDADAHTFVRVNKDDIRAQLGEPWSKELEKRVMGIRDHRIHEALAAGLTVISDDTNLAPKHEARLREIASFWKVEFHVADEFLLVPVDLCVKRDSLREGKAKVGEKVIKEMYYQFLAPRVAPPVVAYVRDPTLPSAVICDLDGTLCLHNGRSPYDLSRCNEDVVNDAVNLVIEGATRQGMEIIFLSGREESAREMTQEWLIRHGWSDYPLWMRSRYDQRNDAIVKRELFEAHVRGKFNIRYVLDDRDRVVKMWRELGLTCLQVAYGDF